MLSGNYKDEGFRTNLPDPDRKWSISRPGAILVRAQLDLENLEMKVEINEPLFGSALANAIATDVKTGNA